MEKNSIGEKIRQHRERLEMTVQQLAEASHCPPELLRRLEAGDLIPSLAPLLSIARALGIRLGTFLDDVIQTGPVINRAEKLEEMGTEGTRIVRFSGAGSSESSAQQSALVFSPLAADKQTRHMEPFLIDIRFHEEHPLSTHEGEEFIYVLAGRLEISYGKTTYILDAGDSIYYDSVVPHNVHAADENGAKILAVVYTPF
ncbi:MAG: XRE family transcriptional regulator [Planctomycetia bacterium]|nr:XRE family transcriptional regulator [Planctomycetia bacterium]